MAGSGGGRREEGWEKRRRGDQGAKLGWVAETLTGIFPVHHCSHVRCSLAGAGGVGIGLGAGIASPECCPPSDYLRFDVRKKTTCNSSKPQSKSPRKGIRASGGIESPAQP